MSTSMSVDLPSLADPTIQPAVAGVVAQRHARLALDCRQVATTVLRCLAEDPRVYVHGQVLPLGAIAPAVVRPRHALHGTCFSSGATNYPDLVALSCLDAAVGINAWDASDRIIDRARTHLQQGGRVFFDSGAFHEAGRSDVCIDFDHVFARYGRLLQGLTPAEAAGATLVMPDRVFDQQGSLDRLRAYRDQVHACVAAGADCLIPVQKPNPGRPDRGTASLAEMYRLALDAVGLADGQVRPGLPAKKFACDLDDVRAFVTDVQPRGIHLLGRSLASPRNAHWLATIRAYTPDTIVTSDACEVTALLGDGRALTDRQRLLRDAVVDIVLGQVAYTASSATGDLYNQPGSIDRALAERLADHLHVADHLAPAIAVETFVEATQQATTPAWIADMQRVGWRDDWITPVAPAVAAALGHRCQAGHLLDLLGPDVAAEAGQFILRETRTEIEAVAGRLVRGIAAFQALGEARDRREATQVLLQPDIFGGFARA